MERWFMSSYLSRGRLPNSRGLSRRIELDGERAQEQIAEGGALPTLLPRTCNSHFWRTCSTVPGSPHRGHFRTRDRWVRPPDTLRSPALTVFMASLASSNLPVKPEQGVVVPVYHALFLGNDCVIGDDD